MRRAILKWREEYRSQKPKDPYTRPNYTINSAMRQRTVWTSRDLIFFFKKKKKKSL